MRASTTAALLLFAIAAFAQPDPESRSRNQPVEPFRIIGNVFYVGASDIASYLIVSTQGHILIDGGFVETAPMIRANIEKVGCRLTDVKILLNTHAHFDHAGGLAALKQQSGATLMASERDAPLLERGGKNDPQFGNKFLFPPVEPDRLLHDGDRVTLGGSTLTAVMTPGHTPGCTTWTMTVRDKGRDYHVVIVGSPTVPNYKLIGNKMYPNIVNDYRHTFAKLKSLSCDVFLGAHGSYFNMQDKLARKARGDTRNLFIDPNGYRQFVAAAERDFQKELKRQQTAR
ncbi:MAG: subclass B3 metallo-beta-lactamase [Acidobacteria bacterium]|nr:MAG: subclass B3 metallo-beta-lactamase [Acidobacteriota bacterium]